MSVIHLKKKKKKNFNISIGINIYDVMLSESILKSKRTHFELSSCLRGF